MFEAIRGIAEALKKASQDLGVSLMQTLDLIQNHEERLQDLEKSMTVKGHLRQVARAIEDIPDQGKKETTMAEFASICHALGLEDLEG